MDAVEDTSQGVERKNSIIANGNRQCEAAKLAKAKLATAKLDTAKLALVSK